MLHKITLISKSLMLVCLAVFIVTISMTAFSDYDFWWHMRKGETIARTGSINNPDSFSYTFSGSPDANSEWLADYIIYQSYNLGGFTGANLLKAFILLSAALLMIATFQALSSRKKHFLIAAIVTVVVVMLAIRFRFFVRPFLFSYLFFCAFIFLLVKYKQSKKLLYLYLLPVAQLLWTNTSKGALFGMIVLLLFLFAEIVSGKLTYRLLITACIVFLFYFINTDGAQEIIDIFKMFSDSGSNNLVFSVGEHQSLSAPLLWGYGLQYTIGFQLIVICCIIEILIFKSYKRVFLLSLFIVFLIPTSFMIRLISFFCLAASGLLFLIIERSIQLLPAIKGRLMILLNLLVCLLISGLAFYTSTSSTYTFGANIKADTFPEDALSYLDDNKIDGNMFNSYSIGGFTIWKAPHRKVFIDGRAIQVYSPEFFGKYTELLRHPSSWDEAEKKWSFKYALLEYDIKDGGKHFAFHLNDNPDWALTYWDNHSAVYLKRNNENKMAIMNQEYKVTKPNKNDFTYLNKFKYNKKDLLETDKQIRKEIEFNTQNQEPRLARAYLLLNFGNEAGQKVGLKELKSCLGMKPDLAMEHTSYASFLISEGLLTEAGDEIEKALSINPYETTAIKLKEKLVRQQIPSKLD